MTINNQFVWRQIGSGKRLHAFHWEGARYSLCDKHRHPSLAHNSNSTEVRCKQCLKEAKRRMKELR